MSCSEQSFLMSIPSEACVHLCALAEFHVDMQALDHGNYKQILNSAHYYIYVLVLVKNLKVQHIIHK